MTTSSDQLAGNDPAGASRPRRHWIWLALLLPLLAADVVSVQGSPALWLLVLVAAIAAFVAPRATAKFVPFACFGGGAYGFYLAHAVQNWRIQPQRYGVFLVGNDINTEWLVPQAFGFLVVGVLLLALTGAPGGRAVRQAWWQLRGTHGEPKAVPALLLLPVLFLYEELLLGQVWFPVPVGGPVPQLSAAALIIAAAALLAWWPRAAAVVAVGATVTFGLGGVLWGLRSLLVHYPMEAGWPQPVFYGAVSLHSLEFWGPIHFDLFAPTDSLAAQLLVGAQGLLLLGFGLTLASRLLPPTADHELAQRAQALTKRVTRLTETRSDATEAAVAELRRVERDLHDGAQARLVAVGMSLRAAEQLMTANPVAALALVAEARETSSRALDDLRDMVRGIYPPVLADRGLADAIRALVLDAPLTVDTEISLEGEPPMPVAAAVYFAVAEALTNVARHADAETAQVSITQADGMLRATITDDGHGGADPTAGTGLSGVERRLATFDGILAISSPPAGPTTVVIEVPTP